MYVATDWLGQWSRGQENVSGGTDAQGKEPYQFEHTEPITTLHPGPTSAQNGLEPPQLALVLTCIHTNEHVLQLSLRGGGCMW